MIRVQGKLMLTLDLKPSWKLGYKLFQLTRKKSTTISLWHQREDTFTELLEATVTLHVTHGYHTEFGKYCLYLWLTRKKMNFQNQIIGPGLIYFSLVFWPFSSPKSHVDIQSRVVSVCLMNNLTSSAPPLICKEWEHWTQETRNGLWSNHPRKGSCQITPWFLTTCYIFQQKPCPKTYQMISKHSLSRKY